MIGQPLPLEHHRGVLAGAAATATTYWMLDWTPVTPLWSIPIAVAVVVFAIVWTAARRGYWEAIAETALDHMMMHPYQPHHAADVARAVNVTGDVARTVLRSLVAGGYANLELTDDEQARYRLTERGMTYGRQRAS